MDANARDEFLTSVTARLRHVLPRVRQVTVFGDGREVLFDSSGFAGPIEFEGYHRVRDTEPVVVHDGIDARCAYDEDGHCLALFALPATGDDPPWHVLLRIVEPRGSAGVGVETVRRLAPLLRRLCNPLARVARPPAEVERRLAAIAQLPSSARRLPQLLLAALDAFGASGAAVSVPALGDYTLLPARTAPASWRTDPRLRPWLDRLAPSQLAATAVVPRAPAGAPAGVQGVVCVPLTGLPGRTVGRFVLLFAGDGEPLPVPVPMLLRLAALVVDCVAEDRDRLTGVWKQPAFLARATELRGTRAPRRSLAILYVKPQWQGWPAAIEPRLKALQGLAAFLRAKLPTQAALGLARGGAFVVLLPIERDGAAAQLATRLRAAAADLGRSPKAAVPALLVRHAVAGPAPGAFARAIRALLAEEAPATPAPAAPAATPHRTLRVDPAAHDPQLLDRLWCDRVGPTYLVRPPRAPSPVAHDPAATGLFVDAAVGVDLRHLDRVLRHAATLVRGSTVLLSVAATTLQDRAFRDALPRLAATLATTGQHLQVLVSARYAGEHAARVDALRHDGWKVGVHLYAGGRLRLDAVPRTKHEVVYVAPDLVQECLRSELSRLQVRELLAKARRAGWRVCVQPADVPRLGLALAPSAAPEATG